MLEIKKKRKQRNNWCHHSPAALWSPRQCFGSAVV